MMDLKNQYSKLKCFSVKLQQQISNYKDFILVARTNFYLKKVRFAERGREEVD